MLVFNCVCSSELVCSTKTPGKPAAKPVTAGGTAGRPVCGSHGFMNVVRGGFFFLLFEKDYWVREREEGMKAK